MGPKGRLGAQENKRTRDPVSCCIDLGVNERFQLSGQWLCWVRTTVSCLTHLQQAAVALE